MTSTPLHWAVAAGNLNEVKNLLNQGIPMNSRTVTGRTALHNAARNGHLNIVQELLRRGAIVNATTQSGKTPLQEAAGKGHPRIVHALLKAGANPKFKSNYLARNAYRLARNNATRNALKTSSAAIKFQNFRKKSIARKRASPNTLARTVFSPERVKRMVNKYGINYLNKV
jgi:ankyrin repeat protein